MNLLESALDLAKNGFPVFPLIEIAKDPNEKKGKTPAVKWKEWATTDPRIITEYWSRHPDAGIGIATGINCVVLDIDNAAALEAVKPYLIDVEGTLIAKTGKGWHYYFNNIEGLKNKANCFTECDGVDIRGEGGFVVAPPSPHQNKNCYQWINRSPMMDAPQFMRDLVSNKKFGKVIEGPELSQFSPVTQSALRYTASAMDGIIADLQAAVEGERNQTLNQKAFTAYRLAKTGWISEAEVEKRLYDAAIEIGLDKHEILLTMDSAKRAATPLSEQEQADKTMREPAKPENSTPAYDWENQLHRNPPKKGEELGSIMADTSNLCVIIENDARLKGLVRWNELTNKIERTRKPCFDTSTLHRDGVTQWTEDDDVDLEVFLADTYGVHYRKGENVRPAVKKIARQNAYHPVRNYLDECHKKWLKDGIERLADVPSDFFGTPNSEYSRLAFRYWMIAAVNRIYNAGCKFDYVMILEGPQGKGKSSILRILGTPWYNDSLQNIDDKDAHMITTQNWIIEIAELGKFSRTEDTTAKNFFSQTSTQIRFPYARDLTDIQRQCVFAGTTNLVDYLKDPSGNRRYWPIICAKTDTINLDGLEKVRDLLWGEAVEMYKRKERYYPTREEEERLFFPEQEKRLQIDSAWDKPLADYIAGLSTEALLEGITNTNFFQEALHFPDISKISRSDTTRLGQMLRAIGFTSKAYTSHGVRIVKYLLTEEVIREKFPERVKDIDIGLLGL